MRSFQIALLIMIPTAVIVWAMAFLSESPDRSQMDPWNVTVNTPTNLPIEVSVFGITLGKTTILEAKTNLDANPKMALLQSETTPLALEVDFQEHRMGLILGRLISAINVDEETLVGVAERNIKRTVLETGTVKMVPRRDDALNLLAQKIVGLTFIPISDFDAPTIEKYFGKPTTVYVTGDGFEHWVYEDKYMDILVNEHGREVIQYILPSEFNEKLIKPVIAEAERYKRGEI